MVTSCDEIFLMMISKYLGHRWNQPLFGVFVFVSNTSSIHDLTTYWKLFGNSQPILWATFSSSNTKKTKNGKLLGHPWPMSWPTSFETFRVMENLQKSIIAEDRTGKDNNQNLLGTTIQMTPLSAGFKGAFVKKTWLRFKV